ncbi:MAG: hypothetical protein LUH22_03995 [Bacteroides sp.]|nr:hypothetical protein [Bacteroides sp.]
MKIEELRNELTDKDFQLEEFDTGFNYSLAVDHIEFICYIEPAMSISFIAIYKWNRNDVKGTYDISIDEFRRFESPVSLFFKKTIENMPQYIGDHTDTHEEVIRMIDVVFK